MTNIPLVSVILPTYNRADLLRRSIGSVINQTYRNWELVIWDDGSTDNTAKVVASYDDARIKYYYGDNHGAAYARNRAIEKSQGCLIAFLDSDDEWVGEKLSIQVEVLTIHFQIDLLFSDFININLSRKEKGTSLKENKQALRLLTTEQIDKDLYIVRSGMPESLTVGNYIATDSIILRRNTWNNIGKFNEGLRNSEDFELWWRMSLSNVHFAYQNKILLTRYKPTDSLSSPGLNAYQSTLKAIDLCSQEAKEYSRNDLLRNLDKPYRNIWQLLIIFYGSKHATKEMIQAFNQSQKYGFRLGSVKLLIKGLINHLY